MGRNTQAHARLMKEIILEAAKVGCALFPNHRYRGQVVVKGKVQDTWVDCGLCEGASDLIGWTGRGQFVAIEVKIWPDKPNVQQSAFLTAALQKGVKAGVAHSVKEALDIIHS